MLTGAPADFRVAACLPLMVRCIHLLPSRLARPKTALLRACRPLARFASAVHHVRCGPHVSFTDRPRACSWAAQEAAVLRPALISLPTLRRMQHERPQSSKARPRSAIKLTPSLSRMCARAHTGPRKRIAGSALYGKGGRPSLEGVASVLVPCCVMAAARRSSGRGASDDIVFASLSCGAVCIGPCAEAMRR